MNLKTTTITALTVLTINRVFVTTVTKLRLVECTLLLNTFRRNKLFWNSVDKQIQINTGTSYQIFGYHTCEHSNMCMNIYCYDMKGTGKEVIRILNEKVSL